MNEIKGETPDYKVSRSAQEYKDNPVYKALFTDEEEEQDDITKEIIPETANGWQKCPICEGVGQLPHSSTFGLMDCPTCKGKRIISTINGKPPE